VKLAAVLVTAAALAIPAAQAKGPSPVLGIDWNGDHSRLAWFDPATLDQLPGRKAPLSSHSGSWSLSPDRSVLAVAGATFNDLRFVDTRRMRVLGDLTLAPGVSGAVDNVTWLRSGRLLATVQSQDGTILVVVDPVHRRLLRRELLPKAFGVARLPDGVALLLGPYEGFGPAVFAVVDANGNLVRKVTVDRIPVGRVVTDQSTHAVDMQQPGFAVDAAGGRAFLVGPDFQVATVDLRTFDVAYHGGSGRSLAARRKEISGTARSARWLGNGTLAVAGTDFHGAYDGQPMGLRLIDTRDWSSQLVDPQLGGVGAGEGLLYGSVTTAGHQQYAVYGLDGALRYRLDLEPDTYLSLQGPYAYVCRSAALLRVLDAATGATLRQASSTPLPACASLLYGQTSQG